MKIKFFYKSGDNIIYRELSVEGFEDSPLKPFIIINGQQFLRKHIIGEIEFDYETD